VLPFEHFANAVMLKHMSGPHGLHLSVDATVRAVIESYTIGRDQFGMEKEFIIEVVQSCPRPTADLPAVRRRRHAQPGQVAHPAIRATVEQ